MSNDFHKYGRMEAFCVDKSSPKYTRAKRRLFLSTRDFFLQLQLLGVSTLEYLALGLYDGQGLFKRDNRGNSELMVNELMMRLKRDHLEIHEALEYGHTIKNTVADAGNHMRHKGDRNQITVVPDTDLERLNESIEYSGRSYKYNMGLSLMDLEGKNVQEIENKYVRGILAKEYDSADDEIAPMIRFQIGGENKTLIGIYKIGISYVRIMNFVLMRAMQKKKASGTIF